MKTSLPTLSWYIMHAVAARFSVVPKLLAVLSRGCAISAASDAQCVDYFQSSHKNVCLSPSLRPHLD